MSWLTPEQREVLEEIRLGPPTSTEALVQATKKAQAPPAATPTQALVKGMKKEQAPPAQTATHAMKKEKAPAPQTPTQAPGEGHDEGEGASTTNANTGPGEAVTDAVLRDGKRQRNVTAYQCVHLCVCIQYHAFYAWARLIGSARASRRRLSALASE